MFGGAKYMCSDIIQMMIPRKSCSKRPEKSRHAKIKTISCYRERILRLAQIGSQWKVTCNVGLKLKRYIDNTIVSNIAIDVEYTWNCQVKASHFKFSHSTNCNGPMAHKYFTKLMSCLQLHESMYLDHYSVTFQLHNCEEMGKYIEGN